MNIGLKFLGMMLITLASCATVDQKSWSDGIDDTIMWSVSDGDSEIFLLGSVHAASDDIYPLDSEIYAAFSESVGVVVEIDTRSVNPMDAMNYMIYQDGTKLDKVLSADVYKEVVAAVPMLPESQLKSFKPWAVGLLIMQSKMASSGITEANGIDLHFLKKADSANKPVFELETLGLQMSLFDKLFDGGDEVIAYFNDESETNSVDYLKDMLKKWKKGDAEGISDMVNGELDSQDPMTIKMKEALLTKRNEGMLKKIEGYLANNKKYFVIAGAAHIIGEEGLVELLKKSSSNYTISRY